jgi:two-component system chemotaxis response regulator CheB
VDDSAFMRSTIARLLIADPTFAVAGYAVDGQEAVDRTLELQPDVITMDVEMPRMDGLQAVHAIMAQRPTPIVMVSVYTTQGAATTIEALAKGAVDFVAKPERGPADDLDGVREELKQKLLHAARANPRVLRGAALGRAGEQPATGHVQERGGRPPGLQAGPVFASEPPARPRLASKVIVIGASTGGPAALTFLLPSLPPDLAAGVLVVQHMPAGFTKALADRLNAVSRLEVREAQSGEPVVEGAVLIAQGSYHMLVDSSRKIGLSMAPPVHSVRPSVDVLMSSVAAVYGRSAVGVVLTGMGHDGTAGAAEIKAAGGRVIVQDAASSVIAGMPESVIKSGTADAVVPLHDMPWRIQRAVGLR